MGIENSCNPRKISRILSRVVLFSVGVLPYVTVISCQKSTNVGKLFILVPFICLEKTTYYKECQLSLYD